METKTWLNKANKRKLVKNEDKQIFFEDLETIHKKLNGYIKSIGDKE